MKALTRAVNTISSQTCRGFSSSAIRLARTKNSKQPRSTASEQSPTSVLEHKDSTGTVSSDETTKLRGATLLSASGRYQARIHYKAVNVSLGSYATAREAYEAYKAAKALCRQDGIVADDLKRAAKGAAATVSATSGLVPSGDAAQSPHAEAGASAGRLERAASPRVVGIAKGSGRTRGKKVAISLEEARSLGLVVEGLSPTTASATPAQLPPPLAQADTAPRVERQAKTVKAQGKPAAYNGVLRAKAGPDLWLYEAVFVLAPPPGSPPGTEPTEISGGEYETAEEAARAYDALARMYAGAEAETNFPADPYSAWVPPSELDNTGGVADDPAGPLATGQIAVVPGQPLTVDEIVGALEKERGIDVRVVPLAGRSDLAEHLVFVTGRSVAHMRKMADTISRALRKRKIRGIEDPSVENRTGDDWMVVDCGAIIVNVMDAVARECFDLERFYEGMKLGKDPYDGQSYEEWLLANPVPDKWIKRLEKDEAELSAAGAGAGLRRGRGYTVEAPVQSKDAVGVSRRGQQERSWKTAAGATARAGASGGGSKGPDSRKGPDRKVSTYHFPSQMK